MKQIIGIVFFLMFLSGVAQDNIKPDMPVLDSVSVNYRVNSNHVVIGWQPSDSLDTKGYYIYRNEGTAGSTNWQVIDSALGRTTTFYTDMSARSTTQQESYRIAAFDSSHNISPMTDAHSTIFLSATVKIKNCMPQVQLSWTAYKGFSNSKNYRIYRKENDGAFVLFETLTVSQTSFVDTQLTDSSTYCYVLQLSDNNGFRTSSNEACVTVDLPDLPQTVVALNATVVSKNNIAIRFLVDASAQSVGYYKILRSHSFNGTYNPISTISFSSTLKYINYTDSVSDSLQNYYQIAAYSSCGQLLKKSNTISSIVINENSDESFRHKLYWNDIEQWPGGIQRIALHCVNDGNDRIIYSASRAQGYVYKLKDIDLKSTYYSGEFTYYVVYFENENEYGFQDSSKSNEITIYEMPRVYMPNAFTPLIKTDPINNIFKPVASFISKDQYLFIVYDRFGFPIFETRNPEEGWDGRTQTGKPVPPDTYVYFLEYTDAQGVLYEQNGSVRVFE